MESMAILLLVAHLICGAAPDTAQTDLANRSDVRRTCWRLLGGARFGFGRLETAAFIVRGRGGEISAVDWPATAAPDSALWIGAFPEGAVAIVHTHPNWMPSPSRTDAQTARRTHLPVYVITRKCIAETDGEREQVVVDGEWKPQTGD